MERAYAKRAHEVVGEEEATVVRQRVVVGKM